MGINDDSLTKWLSVGFWTSTQDNARARRVLRQRWNILICIYLRIISYLTSGNVLS